MEQTQREVLNELVTLSVRAMTMAKELKKLKNEMESLQAPIVLLSWELNDFAHTMATIANDVIDDKISVLAARRAINDSEIYRAIDEAEETLTVIQKAL